MFQVSTLFKHLRTSLCLKELEMDQHVNISSLSETVFTEVITNLQKLKLIKTDISNKQLTALLTHVLNQGRSFKKLRVPATEWHRLEFWFYIFCAGSSLREFSLVRVRLPRVHPNILGPGLAQFPSLDISGSVMSDQQKGTVFFSILDTRKVRRLSLQNCDLKSVNFVILATSVGCVESANLNKVSYYPPIPRILF